MNTEPTPIPRQLADGTPERLGRYRLVRPISTGGMARVFEARRESLAGVNPRVAIKVILPDFADNRPFQELFVHEARIGSMLQHQNVVQIQDFDCQDGLYYLVMEYVDGITLRRVTSLCRRHGVPVPLDVIAEIGRQICDGLAHAHGAKVAVYNHVSFWAESIDDGIRLSKKVNRRNFGAAFNLCHWLSLEGETDLGKRLDAIAPYLLSVTLCGADGGPGAKGASWDRLIQPLDQGSFDNLALLKAVVKRGYTGPIGLQCYNIRLPARDHLTRSIQAWSAFEQRLTGR